MLTKREKEGRQLYTVVSSRPPANKERRRADKMCGKFQFTLPSVDDCVQTSCRQRCIAGIVHVRPRNDDKRPPRHAGLIDWVDDRMLGAARHCVCPANYGDNVPAGFVTPGPGEPLAPEKEFLIRVGRSLRAENGITVDGFRVRYYRRRSIIEISPSLRCCSNGRD